MARPYSLTLYSLNKPDAIDGIHASQHLMGYGLWSEFSKLPHVTLRYANTLSPGPDQEAVDFTLIHDCHDSPVYGWLPTIRQKTRRHTMVFMEWPYCGVGADLIDHTFAFLPILQRGVEYVRFPCLRNVLAAHVAERTKQSILLDHVWAPVENSPVNWCPKLYEWLRGWPGKVSQLRRGGHERAEHFPDWVEQIPEAFYPQYLDATAPFETFILTHPGSYEHSVLDMTARGIRVLVPVQDGKPFIHRSMIAELNLWTFANAKELAILLATPPAPTRTEAFTDMSRVVEHIDAYCQRKL